MEAETVKESDDYVSAPCDCHQPLVLCAIVQGIVGEIFRYIDPVLTSSVRFNFRACYHRRQVAMYICHVTLGLSMNRIAQFFSRDRSTVSYACRIIEERRDIRFYDELITVCERLTRLIIFLNHDT